MPWVCEVWSLESNCALGMCLGNAWQSLGEQLCLGSVTGEHVAEHLECVASTRVPLQGKIRSDKFEAIRDADKSTDTRAFKLAC